MTRPWRESPFVTGRSYRVRRSFKAPRDSFQTGRLGWHLGLRHLGLMDQRNVERDLAGAEDDYGVKDVRPIQISDRRDRDAASLADFRAPIHS